MEYLADQKLEHTPEEDSPISDDFSKSSIAIPADWPSQQSIPEPDHVQEPQLTSHDTYPVVPSHRPLLEITIPENPPSPASSLGKRSALPTSVVLQPQYARLWNDEGLIHKHSPTYNGAHTIAVPHRRSPPESVLASPETSSDAPLPIPESAISASILNPTSTSPIGYLSP